MARHPAGGKSAGPGARGEKTHLLQTSMHPRPAGKAALGTTQKAFCRHKTRCVNGRRHKPSPQGGAGGAGTRAAPHVCTRLLPSPRGGNDYFLSPDGYGQILPPRGGKRAGTDLRRGKTQGLDKKNQRGAVPGVGGGGRKSGVMRGSPPLPHPAQGRGRKNRRKKSASPCPEPRGRTEKKGGTGGRRRGRGRGAGRRLCACFPLPIAGEGHTRKA